MPGSPTRYQAFMLRCWVDSGHGPEGEGVYRFSLEDPHTGERHTFARLEALVEFLRSQLADYSGGEGQLESSRPGSNG